MIKPVEEIFKDYVPPNLREWYPWVWPDVEWFAKTSRDKPTEFTEFIKKVRKIAYNDLFFFCDEVMRPPNDPKKYKLQIGFHDELCYLLQIGVDIGILTPRGHLKTTIANVDYSIWRLGKNPDLRILLASDDKKVAGKFLFEIRENIVKNKRLHLIFPHLKPSEGAGVSRYQSWSIQEIIVERNAISKEPSITAMGVNQDFTGTHFDEAVYDDLVNDENANNSDRRAKVQRWYEMSLPLLNPGARKVIIGTRYHDADLYGWMIEKNIVPFYKRTVIEDGEYLWNEPAIVADVIKKRDELSPSIFSAQYMNDPIDLEDAEFLTEWIHKWDVDAVRGMYYYESTPPEIDSECIDKWMKTLNIYMGLDPSRTVKKTSDYAAIMVVGIDKKGYRFVLEYIRKKMRNTQIVDKFCDMFDKWHPMSAGVETVGGDEHFLDDIKKELLKRGSPGAHKVKAFFITRHISKEDRIRKMQSEFEKGNVIIKTDMVELVNEILRFPKAKHDDLIDILSYLITQTVKEIKEPVKKEVHIGYRNRLQSRLKGSWQTA